MMLSTRGNVINGDHTLNFEIQNSLNNELIRVWSCKNQILQLVVIILSTSGFQFSVLGTETRCALRATRIANFAVEITFPECKEYLPVNVRNHECMLVVGRGLKHIVQRL